MYILSCVVCGVAVADDSFCDRGGSVRSQVRSCGEGTYVYSQ